MIVSFMENIDQCDHNVTFNIQQRIYDSTNYIFCDLKVL